MPRACCDCAVATPSEPACEPRPGGACVDEVACPVPSLAAGGLRSGERDRLPFLPRRGMAEKIQVSKLFLREILRSINSSNLRPGINRMTYASPRLAAKTQSDQSALWAHNP